MKVKEIYEELEQLKKDNPGVDVLELDLVITDSDANAKKVMSPAFSIGHFEPEWREEEGAYNTKEIIEAYNKDFPNEESMEDTINVCSIDFD